MEGKDDRASLLRSRDFAVIVGSVGVSSLGDLIAYIALALGVKEMTDSGLAVAALMICLWGPSVVLAGIAGLIVDRFETTRVLIVVSAVQALAAIGLALSGSLAPILILTVLLGSGAAIAQPAEFALIPAAAGEDRLQEANGHVETARYAGMAAGPLLGGVLAASGGFEFALLVNAATFVVVAIAVVTLRVRRHPERQPDTDTPDRARDGIVLLVRDRVLGLVMVVAFASLLFMTSSAAAEVFFAKDFLDAGDTGYGLLISAWMLGMVIGAVGLSRAFASRGLVVVALVAVVIQGIGLALPTAWLVLWFALTLYVVGGAAHGLKNVVIRTLIHERVPDRLRGRAFAAYNGLRNGAEMVALASGGLIVVALGARWALAVAGGGAIVAGLLGLAAQRGIAAGRRQSVAAESAP